MKPFHVPFSPGAVVMLLVALIGGALFRPGDASAWWDPKWEHRQMITLNTTPAGADIPADVTDLPVLVRLHTGNFDFSKAAQGGDDLRFVSSDGKQVLDHHVESWDTMDGMAYAWVKIPRVLGANGQQHFFLYYGNTEAGAVGDGGKLYDPGLVGVYHLGEADGPPQDRTAYANHAGEFSLGQGMPGFIGKGAAFGGAGDRMVIPASPSMDFSRGFTFMGWVRQAQLQPGAVILSAGEGGQVELSLDGVGVTCRVTMQDGQAMTAGPISLGVGEWHHVALSLSADKMILILDGAVMAEQQLPSPKALSRGPLFVGSSHDGQRFFAGEMDELQFSALPRDPAWVRAAFLAQGAETGLLALGQSEEGRQPSVFERYMVFMSVIIKNITLDGWVIIFSLFVMGLVSWVIMGMKSYLLVREDNLNKKFMDAFESGGGLPELRQGDNSPGGCILQTIFRIGCTELEGQLARERARAQESQPSPGFLYTATAGHAGQGARVSREGLHKVLEMAFVRETKRINSYLIFLTLTVAGAPFLGLLGTVWGVMTTFAALALAGEANLAAIAPGMASALATTVAGLIIAIPALFGYNFLVMKVKDITADMSVFIDRFIQRTDEMR
jgi:biopolymer transport protein ExbB